MRIVAIAGLLLALGCSRDADRDDTDHAQPVHERALAASARPIVAAIYQFHHERGLWPDSLLELEPDYINQDQRHGWALQAWMYNGRWILMNFNPDDEQAVQLLHKAGGDAEWQINFGDAELPLDIRPELPQFVPVNPDDRKKRRRETILQRIVEHPKKIVHQQALICELYKENQFQEAREACLTCLERFPTNWWPNLMLALIDLKLGQLERGEKQLMVWVDKDNDLGHVAIAAYFYHKAGQKEKCFVALRRAADLPLEYVNSQENWPFLSPVEVVSLAVEMSYREDQTELCLAFCNRWQRHVEQKKYGSDEYYLYRAACFLKMGRQADAKNEFETASRNRMRSGQNTDNLKKAIDSNNRDFHYVPFDVKTTSDPDFLGMVIEYK